MPRKHLISAQTNKKQQNQAKIWQKLAREIKAAVKVGGTNVEANPRLKSAILKALQNNLSKESINKNINGAAIDGENIHVLEYEAYGPEGIQIIINAITDNVNRTISNVKSYLNKLGAKLAKQNSLKIFFEKKSIIYVPFNNANMDKIIEVTLPFNIIDIVEKNDQHEIYTSDEDINKIIDELKKNKIEISNFEQKLFPLQPISKISAEIKDKLSVFLNKCDDDNDIQWVVTNFNEND